MLVEDDGGWFVQKKLPTGQDAVEHLQIAASAK